MSRKIAAFSRAVPSRPRFGAGTKSRACIPWPMCLGLAINILAPIQRWASRDGTAIAAPCCQDGRGPASVRPGDTIFQLWQRLRKILHMTLDLALPAFSAPYAEEDEGLAAALLADADLGAEAEARIDRRALRFIDAVRMQSNRIGGV